jgi:hypothetical protein
LKESTMAQYRTEHRGKRIIVTDCEHANGGFACVVKVDDVTYEHIRGIPFRSVHAAQTTGAAFARALIDAELDADSLEHRGYFIRTDSTEQRDGSWIGSYQLHRNDNPVPFRRFTCEGYRGNSSVEAEEHAIDGAKQSIDAEIAAGTL